MCVRRFNMNKKLPALLLWRRLFLPICWLVDMRAFAAELLPNANIPEASKIKGIHTWAVWFFSSFPKFWCLRVPTFQDHLVYESRIQLEWWKMAFKKSLAALVFALPLVFGTRLFFLVNIDALTIFAGASISQRSDVPEKCQFLVPIVNTLVEDLFTNECGDAVLPLDCFFLAAVG